MREGTLVSELAVPFDKPRADLLCLPRLKNGMGERAGRTRSAGADFEKFAGDMRKILSYTRSESSFNIQESCESTARTYSWSSLSPFLPCLSPYPSLARPPG